MKKLLSTLCAVLACANTAIAQVTVSRSDLVGTKWQLSVDYVSQSSEFYEFTKKAFIWHRDDGRTGPSPFYLSNKIPDKFDSTKVGVTTNGCYLMNTLTRSISVVMLSPSSTNQKGKWSWNSKTKSLLGQISPLPLLELTRRSNVILHAVVS